MALIACPECGHQVSTLAKSCPSCGAPVAAAPVDASPRREPVVTAGLLGKVVAAIAAWLVAPWVVRMVAFVAGIVMLIVMFAAAR